MKKIVSLFFALQLLLFNMAFLVQADDLPEPPNQEQEEDQMEPEPPLDLPPQEEEPLPDPEPEPDTDPDQDNLPPEDPPKEEEENEPPVVKILLNEILADPEGPESEDEFIELYNAGNVSVDLHGWRLDDENLQDNYSYKFLNNQLTYILEPGSFLTLFRPETKLTLNNDGDAVYFFDAQNQQVDSSIFDSSSSGHSWGRNPDNLDEWKVFPKPSPQAPNAFLNHPPVPVIDLQGGTGHMKVNVTGENSSDPDGDKLIYLWEFEPGALNQAANPPTYEYNTAGSKVIKLTVTDPFGSFAQKEINFVAQQENSEPEPENQDQNQGGEDDAPPPPSDSEDEGSNESQDGVQNYPKLTLINEFLPDPKGTDTGQEWIELYNETSSSVNLSGWYLDDEEGATAPYKIPEGTSIGAKDYLLFEGEALNLSLKNSTDVVRLLDPNKNESERIEYTGSKEGFSYAKDQQGMFLWNASPTPGVLNVFPSPPHAYEAGDVRFDSVLPNPEGPDAGKEKIILRNMTEAPINLTGWKMGSSTLSKMLPEILLAPHSTQALSASEVGLTLKNTDADLLLWDPLDNVIDQISWKTSASGQWFFNPNSLKDGLQVSVKEVIDGDTIKINWDGKNITVRLLGIDTPETVHPFKPVEFYGKQASDHLKNLLTGKQIHLNFDENKIDKYGRVLAYVYLNDVFVNSEIIKEGFGYAYTRFPFKYLTDFVAYQAEAKSAKRGLWADPDVVAEIEKTIEEQMLEPEASEEAENLISLTESEQIVSEKENESSEDDSEAPSPEPLAPENLACDSEFLKIDSFVPYPKKGGPDEYIQLINTGTADVCLTGWQLDDRRDTGSKPFIIKEGTIASHKTIQFGKAITKLSLNNTDDCVTLISPSGDLADEICYGKTHEGEIFTHAGGNWTSATAAKSKSSTTAKKTSTPSTPKTPFTRESSAYRSELINRTYLGNIVGIDEGEKMLVVQLEKDKTIPVSYASSLFNMNTVKELMDLTKPVEVAVYETPELKSLISLHSSAPLLKPSLTKKLFYPILFLSLAGGAVLVLKRNKLRAFLKI